MSLNNVISKYSTNASNIINCTTFETPLGNIIAAADNDYLYIVSFEDTKNLEKIFDAVSKSLSCKFIENKNKLLLKFEEELSDYFKGSLKNFTIPTKFIGTEFQQAVWKLLQKVPYGLTQTYGDMAGALGRPSNHSRPVGAACGANPLVIVVPCHRLVAAISKGGYSCGIDRKEKLIEHEEKYSK